MMMTRIARHGAVLVALALLAGCISLGGKAPKLLLGLNPENTAPAGPIASGALGSALVILDPATDRKLDVLRIPVQVDDTSIAYLKDVAWVDRPARMFRRLLAETIRARGRFVAEESDDANAGRQMLGGRLIDLGYDARTMSAVVRYDAVRENAQGGVESRRFEASVPSGSADPKAIAPALNRAANQVAEQVAEWVS